MEVTLCDVCKRDVDKVYNIHGKRAYITMKERQFDFSVERLTLCNECSERIKGYCKAYALNDKEAIAEEIRALAERLGE